MTALNYPQAKAARFAMTKVFWLALTGYALVVLATSLLWSHWLVINVSNQGYAAEQAKVALIAGVFSLGMMAVSAGVLLSRLLRKTHPAPPALKP